MSGHQTRLAVDIGGTFTDVVLETTFGLFSTKVLTTYTAPENAIIEGMHHVCNQAKVSTSTIEQIIHGTTLATNALIERRGAKTALITTQGFRDVIEMRTESRFEQYDLNLVLPDPLLARQRRYTVLERVDANGQILIDLDPTELDLLIDQIETAGYESVAIGLIHSYLNPTHEKLIRDAIERRLPNVMVSLSCEVSPQMREYERFNTVVANAYIKPLMKSYLSRLKTKLEDEDTACPIFLMHSGGGLISLENAADFPVRLVESGPAGGAVFAADIARRYGLDKVLSFDMGGTTAKMCLIKNQTPKTSRVFEVARTYRFKKGSGMPISIPVIDMVEIGAGGGSLAHVDALQQIRVGPESAGSEPGPACYGRGGTRPGVTDADLIQGKLDPNNFAGGAITLDPVASQAALKTHIGSDLDMTVENAAFGVTEVVDENMSNAARVHAVENGEDLSEFTMIAFGGAAPLHAGRLCEKLGIDTLIVPKGAGVGSAIGFLRAPFSFEANRSEYMRLNNFDANATLRLLSDLAKEATAFVETCAADEPIHTEYKVYMRYVGQGWEIPVTLTADQVANPQADVFLDRFETEYASLFSRTVDGLDVEITVWAVNATTSQAAVEEVSETPVGHKRSADPRQKLFDPALARMVSAASVARDDLNSGDVVDGPALIVERETTLIVPSSCYAIAQNDGSILVHRKGETS